MIDEHGKRKAKPQPPEIPPHILEDLTPAQKKAFSMAEKKSSEEPAEPSPAKSKK